MSAQTQLAANVNATDSTISVLDASDFTLPLTIQVDRETMVVGSGPPDSTTWSVIRSVGADPGTLFADDQFDDRTVVDGWGDPPWKHAASSALQSMNVANGVATIGILNASAVTQPIYLSSNVQADSELRMRWTMDRMPNGGDTEVSLLIRDQNHSPNDRYLGRVRISTLGVVTTRIRKIIAGTGTSLGSDVVASGTFAPGDWWWIAMQAVGQSPTTLNLKVWREADGEPGTWTNTTTDSDAAVQAAGYQGLRVNVDPTNANLPTVTVDSFTGASVPVGYAHTSGAFVWAVDEAGWRDIGGVINTWGRGVPTFPAPTGSAYLDVDADRMYWRVGGNWEYAPLYRSIVSASPSFAVGEVTITPVANTPTSTTVTGLSVGGTAFYGQATAQTTVIGSTVQGVATTSVTGSGLTVWVYRTNTTNTTVDWMVAGK